MTERGRERLEGRLVPLTSEPGTLKEALTVEWLSNHLNFRPDNRDLESLQKHASIRN